VCEQRVQGRYVTAERPGVELATSRVAKHAVKAKFHDVACSELVWSMLATKFYYAVQLANRSQTSLRPNSIKPCFHVKIKFFQIILF